MVQSKVEGESEVLGLSGWWRDELVPEDRAAILQYYAPGREQIDGKITWTSNTRIKFLSYMSQWLNKESARETAYKILKKIDDLWPDDGSVLDLHFALQHRCDAFYRWRDVDDFALEEAIASCRRSISMHKEAAAAFRLNPLPWGQGIPSHHCFRQLAIIEEKRGNIAEAIRLCEEAKAEGWAGDWDNRIIRLKKRAAKSDQPRAR